VKQYVIIVAAGRGSRMQLPTPKQFIKLDGKPVLLHSINAFATYNPHINIILVLPADQFETWEKIRAEYNVTVPVQVAAGGETRFASVKNGLALIGEENALVGIHDAVRPLVSQKTISGAFKSAERYGSGIPAIPLSDSIRQIESRRSVAVDRSRYCVVQTPQCFQFPILAKAYRQEYRYTFTDDASVVEADGNEVHLVDGNVDNFKLTTRIDLIVAEAMLKDKTGDMSGGTHP
jgi:2-C-methyl-D-erythritol 4-phosphate cytidylyltransferase